jgi:hypothetical protein
MISLSHLLKVKLLRYSGHLVVAKQRYCAALPA